MLGNETAAFCKKTTRKNPCCTPVRMALRRSIPASNNNNDNDKQKLSLRHYAWGKQHFLFYDTSPRLLPPFAHFALTAFVSPSASYHFFFFWQDPTACKAALSDHLADAPHEPLLHECESKREDDGDGAATMAPAKRGIMAQGSTFITDTSASMGVRFF